MSENEPYYIAQSKRFCKEIGMDPNKISRPKKFMSEQELHNKRAEYNEILSVVGYFSKKVLNSLIGTPILIVVSDSQGYLLDMVGDQTIKATVEELGIKLGSHFTQEDVGTNVISLGLQQRHPISLIGTNHYHKHLYEIACYGAAFHYTDEDNLLGTVNIMMPISYQNPLLLTMLSQVVDSIERELLLRKQNRKLNLLNQILITRTGNGIILTNEKGLVTEMNQFAEDIYNHTRSSIIGKSIFDLPFTGGYFKRVIEFGERYKNEELKFTTKTGQTVIYLLDVQPIYEEEKMIGVFGQFRDITERYVMEEKIKEAEKKALAGRIAAGIAHEIRNPLTTVRGYLQFLDDHVDKEISHLFSMLLIPEIDRANKIITDFLTISKPTYKEVEKINIGTLLIDYIWKFLQSEALLHNVEIDMNVDLATKSLPILCNREELLQVFINLFQNSLQAKTEAHLKITISTEKVDSKVQITFSDNGKGIPPSIQTKIFEPFFTTNDEGTGLGLSVSRKIVETHDGSMQVNSVENGTSFIIELPIIT